MLTTYAILVPEAPSNISQEKVLAIQGMSFEQHLVMLSGPSHRKKYKVVSSWSYPSNQSGQIFSWTLSKKAKLLASQAK